MGAYMSEPMTVKESEEGEGNRIKFAACSMQGWRVSQEDAHNCIASYDENSSLFAVYDGHGGAEVAIYLSKHLPNVLKECDAYKNGEYIKALEECYLKIDESIKSPEVIKEIQRLAKRGSGDSENEATADYEDENVGALYEEATMPLDKLVAKYQSGSTEELNDKEEQECKPGSSKACSSSSSSPGPSPSKSTEVKHANSSTSSSSTSESVASSSIAETSVKVNGEKVEATVSSVESSATTIVSDKKLKTEGENGSIESSELIVEGKKIEIELEPNKEDEKLDSGLITSTVNGNIVKLENEAGVLKGKDGKDGVTSNSAVNGNGTSDQPSSAAIEGTGNSPTETPRKKKIIPIPVVIENKPERRSPRKSQQKSFDCSDSDDDSDEDDLDASYGASESEDMEEEGSSVDDEDDDDDDDDIDDYCEEEDNEEDEEDERFLSDVQEPGYDSGCTAVVGFMKWEADGLSLWVANAGDSRCVVCREGRAVDMSHDHKPESEIETKRIVKAGGKVTEDGRVNGGLNLSRAIGDHSYKQNPTLPPEEQMISPLPSVEHIVLNPSKDKFVVLACDGIWNSMNSQEVIDFVGERLEKSQPLSRICEELFDACLAPDTCGDGTGCDNMTAIIVQLPDTPQSFSGSKRRFSDGVGDAEGKSNPLESEESESSKKSRVE